MYARDDICYRRLRNLEDSRFPTLWTLVDTGLDEIIYACVYHSHNGVQETSGRTQHLSEAADAAQQRYPSAQLVLWGDFNARAGREMRKLAIALDLNQLVQGATRVPDVDSHTANCLHLLLTTDPDHYSVSICSPIGSSDHCLVKSVSVYSPPLGLGSAPALEAPGGFGDTSQQTGMACGLSSLRFGGPLAFLRKVPRRMQMPWRMCCDGGWSTTFHSVT
ncbi:hypothetical protein PYW07_013487 [Mythimna separata]|uniref:Endonuclease/exonuclease/phosphatase domain-containing protein n=1 Tax=Mythimna separata TaxID=271217 RepID=A0AAD7Y6J5_MYTSE|nr:hypothetical protein PYW07_013487 [Mythimna separata]